MTHRHVESLAPESRPQSHHLPRWCQLLVQMAGSKRFEGYESRKSHTDEGCSVGHSAPQKYEGKERPSDAAWGAHPVPSSAVLCPKAAAVSEVPGVHVQRVRGQGGAHL